MLEVDLDEDIAAEVEVESEQYKLDKTDYSQTAKQDNLESVLQYFDAIRMAEFYHAIIGRIKAVNKDMSEKVSFFTPVSGATTSLINGAEEGVLEVNFDEDFAVEVLSEQSKLGKADHS